ncbi:MAG: aviRb, partial [Marmoricola sp.]|nr:aviRb [Marmoricola sp.]
MASLPVERPLSARSGRVKTARRLARRSSRAEDRLFLAEGAKALSEALHLPGGVVEVFATEAASEQYAALRKAVDDMGISWFSVGDDAITALSGAVAPQGIVAVCRFLDVDLDVVLTRPVVEDRLPGEASAPRSRATVVICADVRDPGNAGTVIRTADATGADGVVLAGNSVDLYNDKTVRAS